MVRRLMAWIAALVVCLVLAVVLVRWMEPRIAFYPFAGEDETPREYGLAFDAVTLTTEDGERLRAWLLHPSSPPRATIVYFHGNGGNLSNWAPILSGIAQRGYRVLAVDYRGYGLSTGRPTERGLYRDVDAVVAHVKTLKPAGPLVYWGRSLGASMAAYAATVRPPDRIILEASFPNARAAVRGSGLLAALSVFASYRFPLTEFMERVRVPALVIHGDRDSVIRFELGREVYDALPGPKRFVALAGGDHNDAVPSDPVYWQEVDKFVR